MTARVSNEDWMNIKGRDPKIFGRAAAEGPSPLRRSRPKKPRLVPTEHEEQCVVIEWRNLHISKWPELALLHAIPNGGHRHKAVAVKLKAEGVESGVPDLHLPIARRGFISLWIEMKAEDGTVRREQKWWLQQLGEQGNCAVVKHGADEAIAMIKWYLEGKQ
jgi:hypothetical protein